MVGAPISYSGHQPRPPSAMGTNNPPTQAYATPSAPLSTLLPYDGRGPQGAAPYPPTSSPNMSYLFPPTLNSPSPFPPTSAPPPPFPPCSTAQATPYYPNPANAPHAYPPAALSPCPSAPHQSNTSNAYPHSYPPAGYPPQPNNHQAPSGYPTGQPTGTYGQPTSVYPPTSTYNPTNQPPPYYSAPPPAGGVYPPRY